MTSPGRRHAPFPATASRWRDLLALWRPRHWAKNAFVLMPVPFALAVGAAFPLGRFALGLVGFSLLNSVTYAFNDLRDAEHDRQHPDKRTRPVAAGRLAPAEVVGWSSLLLVAGLSLLALTGSPGAVGVAVAYLVLNAGYTLGLKHVPLLDVFVLSSGFVLRVLLGCALADVVPSSWLLLCSSGLALFLSLAKRRADLARGVGAEHRPSLAGYNLGFLDQAIAISAGMTVLAYALYCKEAQVFLHGREFATLPFVLFGVFDYLRVVHVHNGGGSPVDTILSSPSLLVAGLGWVGATLWSLGLV
jgi:4-hydroxybenzoate polyprenyltransferase